MSAERKDMHLLQELVRYHRMNKSARAVARALQISPNTERKYRIALQPTGLLQGDPDDLPELAFLKKIVETAIPEAKPPQETSSAEPYRQDIETLLKNGAGPKAIFDHFCATIENFPVSYQAIKRFCRTVQNNNGVSPEDVAIPVITTPGHIAQVDFGYVGKIIDPQTGAPRKAWVFIMVLAHSRHIFARFVFNQTLETWIKLHIDAFAFFGGVPAVIVPDNLKAAVIRASFGVDQPAALTRSYRELARYYRFRVDPAPPRAPKKKGKVESAVKYVKRNFCRTWSGGDLNAANVAVLRWCREVAGQRVHATTRRRPLLVFESEEKAALIALPEARYVLMVWKKATVQTDSHVSFERRLYSVPWRLIGKIVWLRVYENTVEIYSDDERVATHVRRGEGSHSTQDSHLPSHRVDYRHRDPQFWLERALSLDPLVEAYIRELLEQDDVVDQIHQAIRVVKLLEAHPERAVGVVRRAYHFENYSYRGVKGILEQGLDQQPLEEAPSGHGRLLRPTFARNPEEFGNIGGQDEFH